MELNKEDGGNRKFILVQIPELTDEKSEAFKAGYKKISDITIERNKRVVEKIIAETGSADGSSAMSAKREKAASNQTPLSFNEAADEPSALQLDGSSAMSAKREKAVVNQNALDFNEDASLRAAADSRSALQLRDAPKNLGFKVFQLVKSNFPRAEFKPDANKSDEENVEALKNYIEEKERQQTFGFNTHDLLTEILLKQGFMLNFKLAERPEFTNNRVFRAADGEKETLVCLDEDIKLETIERLKMHNELKFICLERALDTTKKWNLNHYLGEKFTAF